MADDGLIHAYLRELGYSVVRLDDAADVIAEAEDHLYEVADHLVSEGRTRAEAEAEAVARFGSAELVARTCVRESKRGAAVPTTRTRAAGAAALATPALLAVGQYINVTIPRGFVHGIGILLLTLAIPAFVFVLWGLRARHGGLGRVGKVAIGAAVIAPFVAIGGWVGLFFGLALWSLALLVLVVGMLHANVLPVVPLVLLAAGPIGVVLLVLGISLPGGDAGDVAAYPMLLSVVGYLWLGWFLFQEQAVDARGRQGPLEFEMS